MISDKIRFEDFLGNKDSLNYLYNNSNEQIARYFLREIV